MTSRARGRLISSVVAAVILSSALAGCSRVTGNALRTLQSLVVGTPDVSERAADTPYANIKFSRDGSGGLLVLAERAGNVTFWQSTSRQTVALRGGYLDHTRGLHGDLLDTRLRSASAASRLALWQQSLVSPVSYTVHRSWRDMDGEMHASRAAAELRCASESRSRDVPLTTIALRKCEQVLTWPGGESTRAALWIAPDSGRIWEYRGEPWPGSGIFAYQVARPWW